MNMIENFEKMLAAGQDNALLRYSLGTAYQAENHLQQAIQHLEAAVRQDPEYSAAWKAYGKALVQAENTEKARDVFTRGIEVAETRGDIQAAKEMKVFLKRIK